MRRVRGVAARAVAVCVRRGIVISHGRVEKVRRSSSALDGPFCERFCVLFWRVCISHFLQF